MAHEDPSRKDRAGTMLRQFRSDASVTLKQLKTKAKDRLATANMSSGATEANTVFGVPLRDVPMVDGVPAVVSHTIQYLTLHGIDLVGLFRVPGSTVEIRTIKAMFDRGELVDYTDLDLCKSPHTAAAILKLFLRELPEPLLTFELYDCFMAAIAIQVTDARLDCMQKIIGFLPSVYFNLLLHLIIFLRLVSQNCAINKMTTANLAMVFAPNLLRSRDEQLNMSMEDTGASVKILETMIEHFDRLFDNNIKPLTPPASTDDLTATSIQTESSGDASAQQQVTEKGSRAAHLANLTGQFKKLNSFVAKSVTKVSTATTTSTTPARSFTVDPITMTTGPRPVYKLAGPRSDPFAVIREDTGAHPRQLSSTSTNSLHSVTLSVGGRGAVPDSAAQFPRRYTTNSFA